tara:strand:+ start:736 stop:948 length:213 start_codon:yes stop_codon:yes gene_type:complete
MKNLSFPDQALILKDYEKIQEQGYLSIAKSNAKTFTRRAIWSDIKIVKENRGKNSLGFEKIIYCIYGKKI